MSVTPSVEKNPEPSRVSTAILLFACVTTYFFGSGSTPSELASSYAQLVGAGLAASILIDYKNNIRNLVRSDVMSMVALYFFTLSEFLLSQPYLLDTRLSYAETHGALNAVLLGFASLAIGRHFHPKTPSVLKELIRFEPKPEFIISLFWLCFIIGYAYMFFCSDFNIVTMINAFMNPRFGQPWGRGQFGDWKALLYELSMLIFLIPPIAANIIAERRKHTTLKVTTVSLALLFTLFYGFSSGTRNLIGSYLATFMVSYAFSAGNQRKKEIITVVTACGIAMVFCTIVMLNFRNIGLRNYIEGYSERDVTSERSFYVDNNVFAIAKLMNVFPARYDYIGMEIPYLATIRVIPRAIWPEKPKGMSISIEKALDAESWDCTIAATFIGEAYMSNGYLGIIGFGLFFGMFAGWWNQLGRPSNTSFGNLLYASGFIAAVMSMRSCSVFTTNILPTLAAIFLGAWAVRFRLGKAKRISK